MASDRRNTTNDIEPLNYQTWAHLQPFDVNNPDRSPEEERNFELKLVRMAAVGDDAAFRQWMVWRTPFIYRYFYWKYWDKTEADDLTQEVFIKAYDSLARIKTDPKRWLYRVARNLLIDRYRHNGHEPQVEYLTYDSKQVVAHDAEPEMLTINELESSAVNQCLQSLTDKEREVVELYYFEGMSIPEIAEHMSMFNWTGSLSEGNLALVKKRALEKLRVKLSTALDR